MEKHTIMLRPAEQPDRYDVVVTTPLYFTAAKSVPRKEAERIREGLFKSFCNRAKRERLLRLFAGKH